MVDIRIKNTPTPGYVAVEVLTDSGVGALEAANISCMVAGVVKGRDYHLKEENAVTLAEAATAAGLAVERLDRTLPPFPPKITPFDPFNPATFPTQRVEYDPAGNATLHPSTLLGQQPTPKNASHAARVQDLKRDILKLTDRAGSLAGSSPRDAIYSLAVAINKLAELFN